MISMLLPYCLPRSAYLKGPKKLKSIGPPNNNEMFMPKSHIPPRRCLHRIVRMRVANVVGSVPTCRVSLGGQAKEELSDEEGHFGTHGRGLMLWVGNS